MAINTFLEQILAHKRDVNAAKLSIYEKYKANIGTESYTRYNLFKRQLLKDDKLSLIAEIKKASPSKGMLRSDFDILQIAKIYQQEGAAAISVLTEDKYFLGKPEYVKKVADNCELPILTKDFIIDEGQIYEARVNGASAILLIVAILTDEQIKLFMDIAHSLDLDCLVEVHDEEELKRALDVDAEIIGINNRDLRTFEVTLDTCKKLIPQIPEGKVIVAESGIHSSDNVAAIKDMGAHAILVGEAFMREEDIAAKVKELLA